MKQATQSKKEIRKTKILVLGNHASSGLGLIKALHATAPSAELCLYYVKKSTLDISHPKWEEPTLPFDCKPYSFTLTENKKGLSKVFTRLCNMLKGFRILLHLQKFDYIISLTGTILDSKLWYYYFVKYQLKPYFASANGSDIREECVKEPKSKNLMLQFFKNAKKALLFNLDMINLPKTLGISRYQFFPFAIDTNKYKPFQNAETTNALKPLVFLMPSHLDWGETDNSKQRNSTKGNDRFIRAFAKAIHGGCALKLIFLDRGPDKEKAKQLVQTLGIQEHTTVLPELKKNELVNLFNEVDVIVDQFDIGSFGTTALEAMSCQKPVMMYIEKETALKCYDNDMPPILNAKTEEEIFLTLQEVYQNRDILNTIATEARSWILRNHSLSVVGKRLLALLQSES